MNIQLVRIVHPFHVCYRVFLESCIRHFETELARLKQTTGQIFSQPHGEMSSVEQSQYLLMLDEELSRAEKQEWLEKALQSKLEYWQLRLRLHLGIP